MKSSAQVILHAFLQRCPSPERASLLEYLSSIERQAIENLPRTYGDPLEDTDDPEKILNRIHPTWIAPFLRNFSEKEIGLFLASLSQNQMTAVGKELLFARKLPHLSPLGKAFLTQTLLRYLTAEIEDLLPLSCLPDSTLNILLDLDTEIFLLLPDFLGLHDLSIEVKQIIDKNKLTKIYETLSPLQIEFLKMLLQSPEPLSFSKMGLASWNEDREKLKLLIRQRGLNRLAKAIYGQDPSFIWYILHKLDVERALLVQKLSTPLENARATDILIRQILELISYIKREQP